HTYTNHRQYAKYQYFLHILLPPYFVSGVFMSSHPPPVLRAYWDGRADICDLEQGVPKDGTVFIKIHPR
ncbi:MAG: hypothetical protein ACXQT5_03830, partial [Candidatus Syntropharchaeia archaeon]